MLFWRDLDLAYLDVVSQISMHFGTSPKATLSITLQFLQVAYGAPVEWEFGSRAISILRLRRIFF
jgi:hypothetical protein